jgi:hypothetical protein
MYKTPSNMQKITTSQTPDNQMQVETQIPAEIPVATPIPAEIPVATPIPAEIPAEIPVAIKPKNYNFSILILNIIIIIISIGIKIYTYKFLIEYYEILNKHVKIDNAITAKYCNFIYYMANVNIFFTVLSILYLLILLISFYLKKPFYTNKKFRNYSINFMWVISTILSMLSYGIRYHINNNYKKFIVGINYDNLDDLSNINIFFYVIYFILVVYDFINNYINKRG